MKKSGAARSPIGMIIFRKLLADVPGGAKMLHETLCRVQAQTLNRRTDTDTRARDGERIQWLIDLVEECGGYAPQGSKYRPLYETLGDRDDHATPGEPS